ncbi:hypothetical protein K525DRAFT_247485 [Schizophyllum commune Loenen D]|nr:hypothetical protein K525DRAFT_247485 [Schizophyllum commune Loenen D]
MQLDSRIFSSPPTDSLRRRLEPNNLPENAVNDAINAYLASASELRQLVVDAYTEMDTDEEREQLIGHYECHLETFADKVMEAVQDWESANPSRSTLEPIHTLPRDKRPLLEAYFLLNAHPDPKAKKALAEYEGITYRQVHTWFQNRRRRMKGFLPAYDAAVDVDELYERTFGAPVLRENESPSPASCASQQQPVITLRSSWAKPQSRSHFNRLWQAMHTTTNPVGQRFFALPPIAGARRDTRQLPASSISAMQKDMPCVSAIDVDAHNSRAQSGMVGGPESALPARDEDRSLLHRDDDPGAFADFASSMTSPATMPAGLQGPDEGQRHPSTITLPGGHPDYALFSIDTKFDLPCPASSDVLQTASDDTAALTDLFGPNTTAKQEHGLIIFPNLDETTIPDLNVDSHTLNGPLDISVATWDASEDLPPFASDRFIIASSQCVSSPQSPYDATVGSFFTVGGQNGAFPSDFGYHYDASLYRTAFGAPLESPFSFGAGGQVPFSFGPSLIAA